MTDLQSGIEISSTAISGTLKYVTGYTGFSGDETEQSGNYLALHITEEDADSIVCELIGGIHGPVTLDADGIRIARITSTDEQLKVTASKDGFSYSRTYTLTGLTLEDEE